MHPGWIGNSQHSRWLATQTDALLTFYARGGPDVENGGFFWVDGHGNPVAAEGKQLWINARMTYAFMLGDLLGTPGCAPLAQAGLDYLRDGPLHDTTNGGWFWAVDADGRPTNDSKQAYGHAFVLLAAAAGRAAGYDTQDLWDEVTALLDTTFWSEADGLFVDTWDATFSELEAYRGQNANMHLVEAMMLAWEVSGEQVFLDRAQSVAERLIHQLAAGNDWRLPEHYDETWNADLDYGKGPDADLFRPYGSTIGHWLEWSRLLLQLHGLDPVRTPWAPDAAVTLYTRALKEGWDEARGGFAFSTDWDGSIWDPDRYHWVIAEAIGAAVALHAHTGERDYDRWYRRFWDFADAHLIDSDNRSWIHQLDGQNQPSSDAWDGKPDLYHALQATLFARVPFEGSLITRIAAGDVTA